MFATICQLANGCGEPLEPAPNATPTKYDVRQVDRLKDRLVRQAQPLGSEFRIDGVPRSHREQRDMAIEAAAQLMLPHPNSAVAVKDLQSGEVTSSDYKSGLRLL